jgi:hypothetical protein
MQGPNDISRPYVIVPAPAEPHGIRSGPARAARVIAAWIREGLSEWVAALHESRRRQAMREIERFRHLLPPGGNDGWSATANDRTRPGE